MRVRNVRTLPLFSLDSPVLIKPVNAQLCSPPKKRSAFWEKKKAGVAQVRWEYTGASLSRASPTALWIASSQQHLGLLPHASLWLTRRVWCAMFNYLTWLAWPSAEVGSIMPALLQLEARRRLPAPTAPPQIRAPRSAARWSTTSWHLCWPGVAARVALVLLPCASAQPSAGSTHTAPELTPHLYPCCPGTGPVFVPTLSWSQLGVCTNAAPVSAWCLYPHYLNARNWFCTHAAQVLLEYFGSILAWGSGWYVSTRVLGQCGHVCLFLHLKYFLSV